MDRFVLKAPYQASGDQPEAIEALARGVREGMKDQILLGVTGSGKTFTMASVIEKVQMPTLVIAHNKTLAAQLCSELKAFFPDSRVEYFVSYYDYYQPEAYIASSDTYIEKDASINDEIDRMRHSATAALRERKDVIIVASVSCIYSMGDPSEYEGQMLSLRPGMRIERSRLLRALTDIQYERNELEFARGTFRVRVSGAPEPVKVVLGRETDRLWRGTVDMPRPLSVETKNLEKALDDIQNGSILLFHSKKKDTHFLEKLIPSVKDGGAAIFAPFYCEYGVNIHFGKGCFVNYKCTFLDCAPITLEDGVWVGANVTIATPCHPFLSDERLPQQYPDGFHDLEYAKPIHIGSGSWICSSATICGGVTIGKNCIVAAGAVVNRDVPDDCIVAGVPAKVLRKLDEQDRIHVWDTYMKNEVPLSERARKVPED